MSEEQEAFEKRRGRPVVWNEPYADEWSHLFVAPLVDRHAGDAVSVSPDEGSFVSAFVWSSDGRRLAFSARPSPALRTNRDADVFVVDAAGGKAARITDMPGGERPVFWSKQHGVIDSASGHLLGTYNRKLWKVPPSGGAARSLTDGLDENAGFVAMSPDRLLVESSRRTGRGLLHLPLETGKPEWLSGSGFARYFSATDPGGGERRARPGGTKHSVL